MKTSKKGYWANVNYAKRKVKRIKTEVKLKARNLQETKNVESECGDHNEIKTHKFASTVSIAVPGSILDNAQSPVLRTYLAGQIARAACIYQVDEIIVFNDQGEDGNKILVTNLNKSGLKSCQQLASILQYLECPQYLRKHLFPIHNDLKFAGVLNPLDPPHHLRKEDKFPFREGVVVTIPPKPGKGSFVDIGLDKPAIIDKVLEPYIRVTVKLDPKTSDSSTNRIYGTAVSPTLPKIETGKYWGYTVRIANSLNEIFTKSSYANGYDVTIGTSDKGIPIDDVPTLGKPGSHYLIAFGGLQGLELALENDDVLKINDVSLLFDYYVNTCPQQACRTIRTEEAILISLSEIRRKLNLNIHSNNNNNRNESKMNDQSNLNDHSKNTEDESIDDYESAD